MSALIVKAAVAVLPTVDGRERYLYQGAIFDSEGITDAGLEHARAQGLIDDAPEVEEDEPIEAALTQADVDAAVKTATEAKDAELAQAIASLAKEREAFEAEKTAHVNASKAPAKSTPAKTAGS